MKIGLGAFARLFMPWERVIGPGSEGKFKEQKSSGGHGPGRRLIRVRRVQGDPGEQRDRNPE